MEWLTAVLVTLFVWWFSTGLLLLLVRLGSGTYLLSLAGGLLLVGGAVAGIEWSLAVNGPAGVYVAFVSALLLWGWLEMAYLMGVLTGPVREPCPPDVTGWRRFVRAVNVGLYQEFAVIAVGLLLMVATAAATNAVAAWTFATLWFMRWSAKLNLFLGVANVDSELLPERLRYTVSYMGNANINWLFPVSVTLGTALVVYHAAAAVQAAPGSGASTAGVVLATLTALGVIEHWFLVIPLRDSVLWRWLLPAQPTPAGEPLKKTERAGLSARVYEGA